MVKLVVSQSQMEDKVLPVKTGNAFTLDQFSKELQIKLPNNGFLIAKYRDNDGDSISIKSAMDFSSALDVATDLFPEPLTIRLSSFCEALQPSQVSTTMPAHLIPGNQTKWEHMERIQDDLLTSPSAACMVQQPQPPTVIGDNKDESDAEWELLEGDCVPEEVMDIARYNTDVKSTVTFKINGVSHTTSATMDPRTLLVNYLRDNLGV